MQQNSAPDVKVLISSLRCDFKGVRAVDGLDLAIRDGEFISLLGPSGCGKTTTLRMIAGFIRPSGGSIAVNGKIVSSASGVVPPEKRNMSMIFQSYAIWPHMTVRENVAYGLKLRRLPGKEIDRKVSDILAVVRLDALAGRYPAELSGGQQQRVALARAVVIHPEVLLLDEPLSNLDANLREDMRREIKRLHETFGMTTVYVTHDQSEAMTASDRIVVMNRGVVEQIDDPVSLYTRPKSRFVAEFIGRNNIVSGRIEGECLVIGGHRLRASFPVGTIVAGGAVTLSLRPQDVEFCSAEDESDLHLGPVLAAVVDCVYHGEYWDYLVALSDSDVMLSITTLPSVRLAKQDATFVRWRASQMVVIPG